MQPKTASAVFDKRALSSFGHFAQQSEADDEQHDKREHAPVRLARGLSDDADQERSHDGCVLAEDVEEAEILVSVLFRNKLSELGTRKSLDAALEHADHDRQEPELDGAFQEERREQRDAHIGEHAHEQHLLRTHLGAQAAVDNGRRKCHELRDQKRKHQLRGIDAQIGAIARGQLDDGVHAVDIEEIGEHEVAQRFCAPHALDRSQQARERVAHHMGGTLLEVGLMHVLEHGNGENDPPCRRDEEGYFHAERDIDADRAAAEHDGQACDERDAAADIAPRIALAGHFVVTLVGGGVHEQRVVEHHRRVQHDRRHDVDHQKRQRIGGEAQRATCQSARPHRAYEEFLLHVPQIGQAAQNGHRQRDDKRGDGLGITPRHHHAAGRDGAEIHGDERGRQQDEGRIAYVVHDPALLLLRKFADCHEPSSFSRDTVGAAPCATPRRPYMDRLPFAAAAQRATTGKESPPPPSA